MLKLDTTRMEQTEAEEKALKDILKENIKKYRKRRDLSQFALASQIDLSTNFLADIEAGNTWVSAQTLIKLAKAFEIEPYELLKPEADSPDSAGQNDIIDRFSKDLAVVVKNSVDKTVERLKKQYSI